jgi:endoglucanase
MKSQQKVYTRDTLEALMHDPIALAGKLGLPLYCGEWGCLPTVPDSARYAWYRDMRFCLEKNNIAWATWDYKGGFGIIDRSVDKPFNELIEILTGE